MIEVRTPSNDREWDLYYDLRYRVLRKPLLKEKETEKDEGDEKGLHFAYFDQDLILGIARLDLLGDNKAQVRFVAVEIEIQSKGIGKELMLAVEKKCQELGVKKLVLHARDYAVGFYQKLDYKLISPSYKLFGVLQHFLMEKEF